MKFARHSIAVEVVRCPFCRSLFVNNPECLKFHESRRCCR